MVQKRAFIRRNRSHYRTSVRFLQVVKDEVDETLDTTWQFRYFLVGRPRNRDVIEQSQSESRRLLSGLIQRHLVEVLALLQGEGSSAGLQPPLNYGLKVPIKQENKSTESGSMSANDTT